jgi:hypothetical protein
MKFINIHIFARFEVFTAVDTETLLFWDAALSIWVHEYQCFGEPAPLSQVPVGSVIGQPWPSLPPSLSFRQARVTNIL